MTGAALQNIALFPFAEYWWFYLAFTAAVILLLVLDLGLFHRKAHTVSFSEAGMWVVIWVAMAMAFCYGLYSYSLSAFATDRRARRSGRAAGCCRPTDRSASA